MKEASLYTLTRLSELHFVFAAFFDADPLVFVRVGSAARPYGAVRAAIRSAPWPFNDAVLAHIGDLGRAKQFERLMFHRLADHRLKGDWFCFEATDGRRFADVARLTFAELTGRRLQWRHMPLPAPGVQRLTR